MRFLRRLIALLLAPAASASLAISGPAPPGIPDPSTSTVPPYLQMCPAGDLTQSVVVRDINQSPLPIVVVELDFCACPEIRLCPSAPGDAYTIVSGCKVRVLTNLAGTASFPVRGGGVCAGSVPLSANGLLLADVPWSVSPDQDGSDVVDAADAGILASKLGGADLTGDLDGSGAVDAGDAAILTAHADHSCATTPAGATSWGRLKATYR